MSELRRLRWMAGSFKPHDDESGSGGQLVYLVRACLPTCCCVHMPYSVLQPAHASLM